MDTWNAGQWLLGLVAAVGLAGAADRGQAQGLPDPNKGYDWKDVAKKSRFESAVVEQLERDKLVVTGQAFYQVFSAYLDTRLPIFVTSDSVLNAYHVLLEESIVRMERRNVPELSRGLLAMWQSLGSGEPEKIFKGDPRLLAEGKRRAQILIAVAMTLLGQPVEKPSLDAEMAKVVAEEVARVTEASATMKPPWLGKPDPGFLAVDYTRFRPRGLYATSARLSNYFRAYAFLQAIPLRVDRDDEYVTALLLAECVTRGRPTATTWHHLRGAFNDFLDKPDDLGLAEVAAEELKGGAAIDLRRASDDARSLAGQRALLRKHWRVSSPRINDQLRLPPPGTGEGAGELTVRVLPAYTTADSILLARTTDPRRIAGRRFPMGLDVCALLGSGVAKELLPAQHRAAVLKEADACRPMWDSSYDSAQCLHARYLRCLATLLDAPEKDAPALFGSDLWKRKSCNTVLGGWAQARHAWTLQAKLSVNYWGGTFQPPGFVEPEPEFFGRLAELAEDTRDMLARNGALRPTAPAIAELVRQWADAIAAMKPATIRAILKAEEPRSDQEVRVAMSVARIAKDPSKDEPLEDEARLAPGRLRAWADEIERRGEVDDAVFYEMHTVEVDLERPWKELARLCRRLESLAHRQLRGVEFSKEEQDFLRKYGETLGGIMLYGGNAYLSPRDDAPRAVAVHSSPADGLHLHAAVGRPRLLLLLYPYKGMEVLCQGAVLPYHEFPHKERLTDPQWKELLDSDRWPALPNWMKGVYGASFKSRGTVLQREDRD